MIFEFFELMNESRKEEESQEWEREEKEYEMSNGKGEENKDEKMGIKPFLLSFRHLFTMLQALAVQIV